MTKRKGPSGREWKPKAEMYQRRANDYALVIGAVTAFVASDAAAMTYQTLGQYRAAVLKLLCNVAPGEERT